MMTPLRSHRAFALIELMVVVAVLSMAAAFFVPRFLKHRIQQKREECRRNLESLHAAEKVYFEKNGGFTADLDALGWSPQGSGLYRYRFQPVPSSSAQRSGFVFTCEGNIDKDPTLDQAQIDDTGHFIQTVDDTSK